MKGCSAEMKRLRGHLRWVLCTPWYGPSLGMGLPVRSSPRGGQDDDGGMQ